VVFLCVTLTPLLAQVPAGPGDWPAWRGPDRTGISSETGLLRQWPEGGSKLLWTAKGLGDGFSTPSVAKGRIYLMGAKGKEERVIALDAMTGQQIWAIPVGTMVGGHPGPRCTPTIDGERLYALSSDGKLICAEVAMGTLLWKKDLKADFGGKVGGWAYAESPLIDGNRLICTPGGETATLVALDKLTGAVLLKAPVTGMKSGKRSYSTAAYSSPITTELGGIKQYVQFLSGGVVGIAAEDGKLLWHYDKPANGTANCSTPIVLPDAVFAASAYGTGGGLARIEKDGVALKAEEAYFVKGMQNHHGGMILVGNHLYGTGSGTLLCVDIKTGAIAWQERGVGKGSIAFADGLIVHRGESGPVALVEANPMGYREKGRFDQPNRSSERAWPHPVIAGGKLYLRDWDILLCYDVAK